MSICAVIFDLDGTLVNTAGDITDAVNQAIGPEGAGPLTVAEVLPMVGEGVTLLIERALLSLPAGRRASALGPALERFTSHYNAHMADRSRPYDGIPEALSVLQAAGLSLGVLSNKRGDMSRRLLAALGLAERFKVIAGGDEVPQKKPHPSGVAYVLSRLGATPSEAVMVGDSALDIAAGRSAGLITVAASYGFRARESLMGADIVISQPRELLSLLRRMSEHMERRAEARILVPAPYRRHLRLMVGPSGPEAGQYEARLLDVSSRSMRIVSDRPMSVGEAFSGSLSVPGAAKEVVIDARCIRIEETSEGGFAIAAEIVAVDSFLWFRVFSSLHHGLSRSRGAVE